MRRWRSSRPGRQLSDIEQRYRTMVALSPEPLFVLCDEEIVYANQASAELLGAASPDALVGRKTVDIYHPDSHDSIQTRLRQIAQTGRAAPFKEHLYLLPDGATVDVETSPAPITWGGRPATLIAARNISARKQTERALHDSEEHHRDLIGLLPDAVLVSQGNEIVFINPAGVDLYGAASADDLVGRSIFSLIHPDDRKLIEARQALPAKWREPLPFLELRNIRLDGSVLDVESHVTLFPWEGGEARVAVIRDISERRRLETDLAQAQKMEAVGHLTGGMAHEFNNLLQAMLGYLELLQSREQAGQHDQSSFREMIEGAIGACLKGGTITQSLLAFARKQPLRAHAIDLDAVVTGATDFLRGALADTVRLHYSVASGLWQAVADPAQVQTCLINIVINARDALAGSGDVRIDVENAEIDSSDLERLGDDARTGDFVRLSVTDNGAGIPESVLSHVFEPFFTTKEIGEGTGLGLSMVYGFAKQSNGFVAIDSAIGEGTRIELYLPRAGAAAGEIQTGERNGAEIEAAG